MKIFPLWHKLHLTGQTTDLDLKTDPPIKQHIALREELQSVYHWIQNGGMAKHFITHIHISVVLLLMLKKNFKRHPTCSNTVLTCSYLKVKRNYRCQHHEKNVDFYVFYTVHMIHGVVCCWLFQ